MSGELRKPGDSKFLCTRRRRGLLALACVFLLAGSPVLNGSERRPASVPVRDPRVERGHAVFLQNCQKCHPGGGRGVGPALAGKSLPAFIVKAQVRAGRKAMPPFQKEQISDAELDDLVRYVRSL